MPAYFVAENEITNQAGMDPYRAAVGATLEQYGGRFLTRGGATELVEGGRSRNGSSSSNSPTRRRSSAGTIRQNTRKSCRCGSTTRPAAPSSSKA
jgi:Domain of unknown function (DUF1330)